MYRGAYEEREGLLKFHNLFFTKRVGLLKRDFISDCSVG